MKYLLLHITYKFTKKEYLQYQQVPSDETVQNTTALFMSYFVKFEDFMYLYIHMFYIFHILTTSFS